MFRFGLKIGFFCPVFTGIVYYGFTDCLQKENFLKQTITQFLSKTNLTEIKAKHKDQTTFDK
jgi:hypothetical protein